MCALVVCVPVGGEIELTEGGGVVELEPQSRAIEPHEEEVFLDV